MTGPNESDAAERRAHTKALMAAIIYVGESITSELHQNPPPTFHTAVDFAEEIWELMMTKYEGGS